MDIFTKHERSRGELKMADDFVPVTAFLDGGLPRTNYPYAASVRDGINSNVVMSPVNWVLRNFTQAEPVVERKTRHVKRDENGRPVLDEDGKVIASIRWDTVDEHPLVIRMDEPNAFHDGDMLWKATLISYILDGNAYWLKVRNRFGEIIELWYLPHFLVDPKFSLARDSRSSAFIDHYEYRPWWSSPQLEIPVRDIVHFRFGLDPNNTRKGLSPVKPILREVFADEEAANFSASILRNMGVPGIIISPKDALTQGDEQHVQEMRDYLKTGFTGDRRGEPLAVGIPTNVEQFGFDPNQLMLGNLRDIAEERVCAAIGIPAAVVGFGAGLQQTKVGATMKELRRSAWENCVIPMQDSLAKQATRQLMPDFQSQTRRFRLMFDRKHVAAVGAEEREVAERATLLFREGLISREEGRQMVGFPADMQGTGGSEESRTDDVLAALASRVNASRNGD